jgi:hypothetical protein
MKSIGFGCRARSGGPGIAVPILAVGALASVDGNRCCWRNTSVHRGQCSRHEPSATGIAFRDAGGEPCPVEALSEPGSGQGM